LLVRRDGHGTAKIARLDYASVNHLLSAFNASNCGQPESGFFSQPSSASSQALARSAFMFGQAVQYTALHK
jgi:hypothetical protein